MIEQEYSIEQIFVGKLLTYPDDINIVKEYVKPSMIDDGICKDIYSVMFNGQNNITDIAEDLKDKYENIYNLMNKLSDIGMSQLSSVKKCGETLLNKYKIHELNEIGAELQTVKSISDIERSVLKNIDRMTSLLPRTEAENIKMSDLVPLYSKDYFGSEQYKRFMTGFNVIDHATGGIDDGDLIICAARPSCGKTAFGLDIIRNNASLKAGYFNLEMSARQIYERQIASIGKIPLGTLRRSVKCDPDTMSDFNHSNKVLSAMTNCELISGAVSVTDIERYVRINQYDFIVVDYLGLIQTSGQYKGNRYAETSAISIGLKRIAMKYHIPVIALAQLNRESAKRDDKEPFLPELRDSGSIEQDASIVIMLWEHEEETKRNIKIEKCRNGQRVRSTLNFNGEHMHFSEIELSDINPFTKEKNP